MGIQKITNEIALKRINEKCKEKNIEFIGFDNEENKYGNDSTHLILKCNKCGNVWKTTTYGKFVRVGRGCPNCCKTRKLTENEIIEKIKELCEEKNYSFLGFNGEFNGISTKLLLKCNICGKEWGTTTFINLRQRGRKSHTCGKNNPLFTNNNLNEERAIKRIKRVLENTSLEFISFDENGYVGCNTSHVMLKCKKCGEINKYLFSYVVRNSACCKNCEGKGRYSDEFARKETENKCKLLNYSLLGFDTEDGRYHGKNTRLILKCNKCNHIWKSTTFASFRQNVIKCLGCVNSWKMEKEVESYLNKHSIKYVHDCRNHILPWLKNKISLSLDFYLPDYNVGIECQGRQHFEPVSSFGGDEVFQATIERDKKKLQLCKENGVKLLYYDSEHKHTEFLGEKVYNDENKLLKEITSYEQKN